MKNVRTLPWAVTAGSYSDSHATTYLDLLRCPFNIYTTHTDVIIDTQNTGEY